MSVLPWQAWLATLVAALPSCVEAWDLRVSKGLYARGYDTLRVSAISSEPEDVPAPWTWSWEAPFKHHWKSKTLRSHILRLGGLGRTVSIGGEDVHLKLPAAGEGASGLLISDPCFTSRGGFRCPNGDRMDVLERTTQILNKLLGSDEFHFWGVLGDNFYDMHGEVTSEFFSRLTTAAKAKPFFTVVGNHDLWMGGAPPGLAIDELGYGFAQFYGQDTFASTSAGPYNLSGRPEQLEIAAAENFIFATQLGDLALFGYSGAHDWASTKPHAEGFCRFVGAAPTVNAVVLLGHWNLVNLGCQLGMDVPTVYRRMREMPGCNVKRMIYFMGHEHCNQVTEQISGPLDAVGFMIGGAGMWGTGCSQFGVTILRSIPSAPGGPNVAVEYVPLGEDASFGKDPLEVASGFDDFFKCLNTSSYGGCREQHALSFRAVSEDTIVLPRPLQKPSPPPRPQPTPVPARTARPTPAPAPAPAHSSTPAPAPPSMASPSPAHASGAAGMGVAAARTGAAGAASDAGTASIASSGAGIHPRGRTGPSGAAGMAGSARTGSGAGTGNSSIALAMLGGALAGGGAVAIVGSLLFCWLRPAKARETKERGSLLARCTESAEGRRTEADEEDEEEPSPAPRRGPSRLSSAGGREGEVRWADTPEAEPRSRSNVLVRKTAHEAHAPQEPREPRDQRQQEPSKVRDVRVLPESQEPRETREQRRHRRSGKAREPEEPERGPSAPTFATRLPPPPASLHLAPGPADTSGQCIGRGGQDAGQRPEVPSPNRADGGRPSSRAHHAHSGRSPPGEAHHPDSIRPNTGLRSALKQPDGRRSSHSSSPGVQERGSPQLGRSPQRPSGSSP